MLVYHETIVLTSNSSSSSINSRRLAGGGTSPPGLTAVVVVAAAPAEGAGVEAAFLDDMTVRVVLKTKVIVVLLSSHRPSPRESKTTKMAARGAGSPLHVKTSPPSVAAQLLLNSMILS
jgi:hypothetical protein